MAALTCFVTIGDLLAARAVLKLGASIHCSEALVAGSSARHILDVVAQVADESKV